MKSISRFEADLLRILRSLLGRGPVEQTLRLIVRAQDRPRCLSRNAVELVRDTLAKGTMLWFAERSWRKERFLRNGAAAEGRLWERTPPAELGLTFSKASLDFLIWLTAFHPATSNWTPPVTEEERTPGDDVLLIITFDRLADSPAAEGVLQQGCMQSLSLPRLLRPDKFSRRVSRAADFTPWLQPDRAWVLEALQSQLAERWCELELRKRSMTDWEQLRTLGNRQQSVLDRFFEAVAAADRWDLARFVLRAATRVLRSVPAGEPWFPSLSLHRLRLADRTAVYEAGLVLLRQLERLQTHEQFTRGIGYFDEGYAAAQLWKSDWERLQGNEVCAAAREILDRHVAFRV